MDAAEYRDNQPEAKSAVGEAYEWVESFLVPLLAFLLIFTFFARLATVNGISMLPTLHNGERLILQQAATRRNTATWSSSTARSPTKTRSSSG